MLSTQHGMQEQGQNPEKLTLVLFAFPISIFNVTVKSMYHLRGREALQQSRRLRWALNRSWLSHVPDDNLCIPKICITGTDVYHKYLCKLDQNILIFHCFLSSHNVEDNERTDEHQKR